MRLICPGVGVAVGVTVAVGVGLGVGVGVGVAVAVAVAVAVGVGVGVAVGSLKDSPCYRSEVNPTARNNPRVPLAVPVINSFAPPPAYTTAPVFAL